jgi:hypothetical protein
MADDIQESTPTEKSEQAEPDKKDIDSILDKTITDSSDKPSDVDDKSPKETQDKTTDDGDKTKPEVEPKSTDDSLLPREDFPEEDKEYFNSLDEKGKKLMLKHWGNLEGITHKTKQELDREKENLGNLRQVAEAFNKQYEPHLQNLKAQGIDPLQYNAQMLEIARIANENPVEFIKWHAKNKNVDLTKLSQSPEELDPTTEKIQNLERQISGLNQHIQQRETDTVKNEIELFKTAKDANGNLKYPYFETFKTQMAIKSQQTGEENLEKLYSCVMEDVKKVVEIEANKKMTETQKQADLQKAKQVGTPVKSSVNTNVSEKKDFSLDEAIGRNLR